MKSFLDLTDRFPLRFDVERMRAEVRAIESDPVWLEHYDRSMSRGWTALPLVTHHGRMDGPESQRWGDPAEFRRTAVVDRMPYFASILDAFRCPHGRVRVLRLAPGAEVREHRDMRDEAASFAFGKVRLHVPIWTNDRVLFRIGGRAVRMAPGRLYYGDFTKTHYVRNDGDTPRAHLVLDLVVNDFLRDVFPARAAAGRAVDWATRRTVPVFWSALRAKTLAGKTFWANYDGSAVQAVARRVRGKRPEPAAAVRS